jgi:DNA-binding SARP family transcriptional activator
MKSSFATYLSAPGGLGKPTATRGRGMGFSLEQLAIQQLSELPDEVRLVVLHPNYAEQHLLLKHILDTSACAYIRFSGHKLTASELQEQVETALHEFATEPDLASVPCLILDECDRGLPDEFDRFLQGLMSQKTSGRIIILTRLTPRIVVEDDTIRPLTRFIPVDEALMLWDYAQHREHENGHLLEVHSLGAGRVLLDGQPIHSWDGVLPRSLFFYLVDRGMTTRNDIFDTFWSTLTTREATNVFHVTKRKISEVLKTDLTVYANGYYRISSDLTLSYDAMQFFEAVQNSGILPPAEAAIQLERALAIYRADFLSSIEMNWTQKRREELRQAYEEALTALADIFEHTDKQRSLGLYLEAVHLNPQREDIAFNVMRLYRELDMPQEAVQIYQQLETRLQADLDTAPAPYIQEFLQALLDEHDSIEYAPNAIPAKGAGD